MWYRLWPGSAFSKLFHFTISSTGTKTLCTVLWEYRGGDEGAVESLPLGVKVSQKPRRNGGVKYKERERERGEKTVRRLWYGRLTRRWTTPLVNNYSYANVLLEPSAHSCLWSHSSTFSFLTLVFSEFLCFSLSLSLCLAVFPFSSSFCLSLSLSLSFILTLRFLNLASFFRAETRSERRLNSRLFSTPYTLFIVGLTIHSAFLLQTLSVVQELCNQTGSTKVANSRAGLL